MNEAPNPPLRLLAILLAVAVIVIVAAAGAWVYRADARAERAEDLAERAERREREDDRRTACHAGLEAEVLIAFGLAFSTPPAPDVDRLAATAAIAEAAERLKAAGAICR